MSGLYNWVFGQNEGAMAVLAAAGIKNTGEVGRFRDAWLEAIGTEDDYELRCAVYTRNGGGNRYCTTSTHFEDKPAAEDCGDEKCYGCIISHRLLKHPQYLSDKDDGYDSTYATVYFKLIPEAEEFTREMFAETPEMLTNLLAQGAVDTDERWKQAIAALNEAQKDSDASL